MTAAEPVAAGRDRPLPGGPVRVERPSAATTRNALYRSRPLQPI